MSYSIVLCTYNGEKYIKEQLDSFANQTILPDELVICDDGSKDKTLEIINKFKTNSPFEIKVIVNKINVGVTKNFENACKNAVYDIIFFSDQDDIWFPSKAEKILKAFEQNSDKNVVFTDAILFDEKGEKPVSCLESFGFIGKKKRVYDKSQLRAILMGWFCTGATMAAKRDFIMGIMPFPSALLHDQWISFLASINGKLLSIEESLIKYRQHNCQIVGAKQLSLSEKISCDSNFEKQISIYKLIKENLIKRQYREEAVSLLDGKIEFLQNRNKVKNANYISGFFIAIKVYSKGLYSKYSDKPLKSLAKDVLIKER